MTTVSDALAGARERLAAVENPHLEGEILLAHVLGRERAWLHAWPQYTLADSAQRHLEALLERRWLGEPIAYLTGRSAFHAIDLAVSPAVLIPRPESEILVDQAIARIGRQPASVLDLGTGSGCIALAIAHACPQARITASDHSAAALAIADSNARHLGLDQVRLVRGDWYQAIDPCRFDVIVSNPPYIATGDPHLQQGDLRFEPASALTAGDEGLDALAVVIAGAAVHLRAGGMVAVEHGMDQAASVGDLYRRAGFRDIHLIRDTAGLPRVTRATR